MYKSSGCVIIKCQGIYYITKIEANLLAPSQKLTIKHLEGSILFDGFFGRSSNLPGYAVAQLVEALRYKSEGRGFDSRWCHWNFSLT